MIERDFGEGGHWYIVAVSYPTALQAKNAWMHAESKLTRKAGDEGVGVTRLAPNPALNTSATGVPSGRHPVVVVTLDLATAQKAQRLLHDGEPWTPEPDFADALIYRRVRVMAEHEGETGRVVIRRGEGAGASIGRDGVLHEHDPGQG